MSGFKITDGRGFHITFANGWTLSVQFGAGNYCDNYKGSLFERHRDDIQSGTAEVAFFKGKGLMSFTEDQSDTVRGYVSPDTMARMIAEISAPDFSGIFSFNPED